MNKADLDLLELVFAREIRGMLYQTKSKQAKRLEEEGYLIHESRVLGYDRFGAIRVDGYSLTLKGNFTYCTSERCTGAKEEPPNG